MTPVTGLGKFPGPGYTEEPEGAIGRSGGEVCAPGDKGSQVIIIPKEALPADQISLFRGFQV
jgi:hypothetical protein